MAHDTNNTMTSRNDKNIGRAAIGADGVDRKLKADARRRANRASRRAAKHALATD